LLTEEASGVLDSAGAAAVSPAGPVADPKSEHYGDAAFLEEMPRMIDLVPRHWVAFVLLLLGGVTIITGLEALYAWMPQWAAVTTDGRIAAFDLDSEGSLGAWFSALVLLAAALVALLVYSVRRYKTDDYHGHYRIWLWAAMCWFLMATDESASLHEGFKELMALLTGTRLLGDGSIWWVVPYFFLLGAVGSRLLVDMRHCRPSSAALVATAVCYALAVAAQLELIFRDLGAREVMFEEGAEMVGNLLLLLAMALHARYVILDAEGLLPRRAARADDQLDGAEADEETVEDELEEASPAKPAAAAPRRVAVDPPHVAPHPLFQTSTPVPAPAAGPSPVNRKLTKQERKALKMRLLRERQQREQKRWNK
jgi:hypothetical protein